MKRAIGWALSVLLAGGVLCGCGHGLIVNAFAGGDPKVPFADIIVVQRLLVQYHGDDKVLLKLTDPSGLHWSTQRAHVTIVAARATAVDLPAEE